MEEKMLIICRNDVTPEQMSIMYSQVAKQVNEHSRVVKAKQDLAQALCDINSVSELDDVVSHFLCKIVPIFRNHISSWNMNRKDLLELLR